MTETLAAPIPRTEKAAPAETGLQATCTRLALLEAVTWARDTVKSRTPKPILLCAMLETTEAGIMVRATDLEIAVRCETSLVQIERHGRAAVNAERLADVLRAMSDETVSIDAGLDELTVKGKESEHSLALSNPNDYPPNAPEIEGVTFTMPLSALTETLGLAKPFISKTPPAVLGSVFLEAKDKQLTIAATDGKRLYRNHGIIAKTQPATALIPPSVIDKLLKLEGDGEQPEITVTLGKTNANFTCGNVSILTNLIEGQFPPIDGIIREKSSLSFTTDADTLRRKLQEASVSSEVGSEGRSGVRMAFNLMGMTLTTNADSKGKAVVRLPGKWDGGEFEIGVNPFFLLDCIRGCDGEVTIEIEKPSMPIIVRDSKSNAVKIVMPIDLNA